MSEERDEEGEAVEIDAAFFIPPSFMPGSRCVIQPGNRRARVMFVGMVPSMPAGYWIGVQYDEMVGKNDGALKGKRFFTCPKNHGGFVRASKVHALQGEEKEAAEAAEAALALARQRKARGKSPRKTAELVSEAESTPGASSTTPAPTGESGEAKQEFQSPQDGSLVSGVEPYCCTAAGLGLHSAVVGSLAQFTVTACDGHSNRLKRGGDAFIVLMRGQTSEPKSQPDNMRVKVTDRGDGTYMCEYRPYMTGYYLISITLLGENIAGSPFDLSVVTLRPDPEKCIARGKALRSAVARMPETFEVLFVDAIGNTAHAEDLDVWVEAAIVDEQVDVSSPPNQDIDAASIGLLTEEDVKPEAPEAAPEPSSSPTESKVDSRSPRMYRRLDAPTRQSHIQLWATRLAGDKWHGRRTGSSSEGQKAPVSSGANSSTLPTFTHELTADKFGFAFGGVEPGTLHARGKLIKVHSVHYSIGLAGKYKLHIGLRQQDCAFPGSPFDLEVVPGHAYAATTKLPDNRRHHIGVADEESQHGLLLHTHDMLGNACIKGGAKVTMISKAHQHHLKKNHDDADEKPAVQCTVLDKGDGSYELRWCCQVRGSFPLDVFVDGALVSGSPITLTVRAAAPSVERFVASGAGLASAIAGEEAKILIRASDRFDNIAMPGPSTHFGLVLIHGGQTSSPSNVPSGAGSNSAPEAGGPASEKKKKTANGGPARAGKVDNSNTKQKTGRAEDDNRPSMPFKGAWVDGNYDIRYVAQEAGTLELNLWCVADEGGLRQPMPGSPFIVHVSEGAASATGSYVREAESGNKAGASIIAGEHVVLRPQIRDLFENSAAAKEGTLTASLESPGEPELLLEAPKERGGLGAYELALEPTKAGQHAVHIRLSGEDITGSPVNFYVAPAGPNPQKCYLSRSDQEPVVINETCDILLSTHDKYGNQLDRGGVRVDAKALGAAVSVCTVEDNKDGTYKISLTAGAKGEVKVTARVDSVEIKTLSVFFVKEKDPATGAASEENDPAYVPGDETSESELSPKAAAAAAAPATVAPADVKGQGKSKKDKRSSTDPAGYEDAAEAALNLPSASGGAKKGIKGPKGSNVETSASNGKVPTPPASERTKPGKGTKKKSGKRV